MFKANLNVYEVYLYFSVYVLYLCYGFWAIANARLTIFKSAPGHIFENSWSPLLGKYRDNSSHELQNFVHFIKEWWPWYVVHASSSLLCKLFNLRRLKQQHILQSLVCVVALVCMLQPLTVLALFLQLCSFYIVAKWNSKLFNWLLAIIWMATIHAIKSTNFILDYNEFFTFILLMSWSLLRCCSYALTKIADMKHEQHHNYTLSQFLGYTLYFPTLIYGPFFGYRRYIVLFDATKLCKESVSRFIFGLLRTAVWWLLLNILLHFLYVHYMAYDEEAIQAVGGAFEQHAVGYYMGQLFFLYYIVTYGLGIAFAEFDGLQPPHRPRCVGRIHFYSDMWKYFDEGLYEFLFTHIYAELRGRLRAVWTRLGATAAVFVFVYIWHGCYTYVLTWSVLNFACLVAEKCFKQFIVSHTYRYYVERHLNETIAQRLRALLATQLFIPAAFSNIYFISGQIAGNTLMYSAYCNGLFNYLALTFCSYCFFQCSEYILNDKQM